MCVARGDRHPTPRAIEQSLARAAAVLGGADAGGNEHVAASATGGAGGGVTLATVFDDDDPKKLGRVRVQYAFQEGAEASHWLRVAGHGGGKGHGAGHVPLKGNLVAVAPVQHDAEHPLVIGAVYDQTDAGGQTKDRIQVVSRSGSGLALNTGQGGAEDIVELHTPGGKALIELKGSLITIHAEGDLSIEAPNGELRISAKSMKTHVATNVERKIGGTLDDAITGAATIDSSAELTINGATMHVNSDGVIQTQAGAAIQTQAGGAIETHAGAAHTITGKPVHLNP